MGTWMTTNVTQPATSGGTAMRERLVSGLGAYIAPAQAHVQGTTVPAGSDQPRTFVKKNPAAIKDGAASGLRSWRHPV